MKQGKPFAVGLLLILLMTGAYFLYHHLTAMEENNPMENPSVNSSENESGTHSEPPKTPARDFTVYDIEGKAHKLSDFQGKPVIMNFWASWCDYCKMEMPYFEKMYQKYGNQIHFLMIHMTDKAQETEEKGIAHVRENGYTFPVYFDLQQQVAQTYPVRGLPMTYFVDADGNLAGSHNGVISEKQLQTSADMLLKEP